MTQLLSGDTNAPVMGERRKGTAIVIGGGFGGLATAIRLQAAGQAVTLVEARERLGGRAYQLEGRRIHFRYGPQPDYRATSAGGFVEGCRAKPGRGHYPAAAQPVLSHLLSGWSIF